MRVELDHLAKSTASGASGNGAGLRPSAPFPNILPFLMRPADFLEIGLVHLRTALLVGVIVGAGAAFGLAAVPKLYEARDLLLVQMGRDFVYVPDAASNGMRAPDPGTLEPFVNAEMQILDSHALREALLDDLLQAGILTETATADRAALLDRLDDALSINLITGSYIIDVRVRDSDADRSMEIARRLVAVYQRERSRVVGVDTPAFLSAQIDDTQARIAALDATARDLTGAPDIAGFDTALAQAADAAKTAADDLAATRLDLAGLQARLAKLDAEAGDLPADSAARDRARGAIAETRADLDAALARSAALESAQAAAKAAFAAANGKTEAVARLRDQRDAETEWLGQLQVKLRESDLGRAKADAGFGSVRLLDTASKPKTLGLPARTQQIAALLLGLAAALGTILLAEMRKPRLYTASLAHARIGLPVLGEVEDRASLTRRLKRSK